MTSNVCIYYVICLCLWVSHVFARGLLVSFPTFNSKCESKGQVCIPIRTCPFFADLLDNSPIPRPRTVIDIIRKNHCGLENNTPYMCCDKPTSPTTTTTTTTSTTTTSTTTSTTPPPPQLQREERDDSLTNIFEDLDNEESRHKNFKLLRNDICGSISTNSRITSGNKTALNEFPWMALIAYNTDHGVDFRCGGTVINERYVLTAAHCILNFNIIGVRLGEHNLETIKDCDSEVNYCAPPTQDFNIEEIKMHPLYDSKTYNNDIALIRLATPANFSFPNVQPICLPSSETDSIGKYAIVSGWGVTESGFKSSELLKVSVPVLPISVCQRSYKRFATITSNQICAGGYKGRDSCGGDSGGPLKYVGLIDGTPRFIQYGIVSYGPRYCGTDRHPGLYTKVTSYLKWVLDNLKPNEDEDDLLPD